jgi:hypothetical protein
LVSFASSSGFQLRRGAREAAALGNETAGVTGSVGVSSAKSVVAPSAAAELLSRVCSLALFAGGRSSTSSCGGGCGGNAGVSALAGTGKVRIPFLRRNVPPITRPLITYFVGMKVSLVVRCMMM